MGVLGKMMDRAGDAALGALSRRAHGGSKVAGAVKGAIDGAATAGETHGKWANVTGKRWEGPQDERQDYYEAAIRKSERGDGWLEVLASDGSRLCTITPKMRDYETVLSLFGRTVDHLVVERREGEWGEYWRVGFYYWPKG